MRRKAVLFAIAGLASTLVACSSLSSVSLPPRNATVNFVGPITFSVSVPGETDHEGVLPQDSQVLKKLQRLIHDQSGKWRKTGLATVGGLITIKSDNTFIQLSPNLLIIGDICSQLPAGAYDDIKHDLIAASAANAH